MKKSTWSPLAFIMFCALFTACSPKIASELPLQQGPVVVDGKADEYREIHNYASQTKMIYSLSNDRNNLYVCLKIGDEPMQKKIMRAGMEIWIDSTSRAKERTGILYPLANGNKMNYEGINPGKDAERQKPDVSQMREHFLLGQSFMQLVGFKHVPSGLRPLDDHSGIKVKINWDDNNTMIYEAAIPLKTFCSAPGESNRVFLLTIDVNALEANHGQQGEGHGGGSHGGGGHGGGGHGGGEMPGGHLSGDNTMRSALSEKNTFSTKFRLNINAQ